MRNHAVSLSFCVLIFHSVCVACHADLLVGTAFEGGVWRIDETTGVAVPGGIAPGSGGLAMPSGVAVGPNGNIYVSSLNTGQVLYYDGDSGAPLGVFATLPTEASPNSTPGPLRFGPDGNLYVSDFGGAQVRVFDGMTGAELSAAATVAVGPPAGLTFDSNGDLYVGDFGSASVMRVSGGVPSSFITPQSGGLIGPTSLLFLPDGDLLVVDVYGNKILRFDENGQNPSVFAEIPPEIPEPLPPGANFPTNSPSDIAFDSNGNLVLAIFGITLPDNGALLRYDQSGNLLETILDMQTPFGSVAQIASANYLYGDYDRSGQIEPVDYDTWRGQFGAAAFPWDGADGNGDRIIDAADYVIWRKMLPAEVSSDGGGVPEPSTGALVGIAAFFAFCSKRRLT